MMSYAVSEHRRQAKVSEGVVSAKKKGQVTRTTSIPTEEEKKRRTLLRDKRYRQNKMNLLDEAFGTKCFFCGFERRRTIHRKDGSSHKTFANMSRRAMIKEIKENKNAYVRLCWKCHRAVHWCMQYLALSWDEITKTAVSEDSNPLGFT